MVGHAQGEPQRGDLPDLDAVEAAVTGALATGDPGELSVLGYGEISLVVGWPTDGPRWACKRMPPSADPADLDRFRAAFDHYLTLLRDRGVTAVPSEVASARAADGRSVAYVVQPVLDPATLGPQVLSSAAPDAEHPLVVAACDAAVDVCDATTGFDGQISNWAFDGDEARYLDVSTPMLFHLDGRFRLDVGVFLAAYPAPLRAPLRRFVVPDVIGAYRDPRHVLVDLAGNLCKERLEPWLPAVLAAANDRLGRAITEDEVRAYYRSDARLWEVMLRLRRADRWWQRRVRRRPYPYLLPGVIAR